MGKAMLLLAILLMVATITAPAAAQSPWADSFDYPNGMLNYNGIWQEGTETTQIYVENGTVAVTGGADDRYVRGRFETAYTGDTLWTSFQVLRTAPEWVDGWTSWIKWSDENGKLLARWQLCSTHAVGRIVSNTQLTEMDIGWNTLVAKINLSAGNAEYFLNGVSLGTVDSEAGYGSSLATVTIAKWTDVRSAGMVQYYDNFAVAVPEPGSMLALGSGLIGLAGFAIRRRRV